MNVLTSRSLLSVKGQGVLPFLQGLITQDVELLNKSTSIGAVFLNPKGRVLSDCLIVNKGQDAATDGVFIDLPAEKRDAISNMLTRHRLRLPLSIDKIDDVAVGWTADGTASTDGVRVFADPRTSCLPNRWIGKAVGGASGDETEYRRQRLLCGVPEGAEIPADAAIPILYNFDFFNCVSFNKGCYTGQELVTRTIRRGVVRRRVVVLQAGQATTLSVGAKVEYGGSDIGTVIAAHDSVGLALVQIGSEGGLNLKSQLKEAVEQIDQTTVTIGGGAGRIELPSYCL